MRRPVTRLLGPLLLGALALGGCRASTDEQVAPGGPVDQADNAGGSAPVVKPGGGGSSGSSGAAGAAPAPVDCEGVGGEIYMVTEDGFFLSFEPPTKTLTVRGQPECSGFSGHVYSMAVDRKGQALVLYQDGRMARVDPVKLTCQPAAYAPSQQGWQVFGMGYATVSPSGGPQEALFVADGTRTALHLPDLERGLGRIDGSASSGLVLSSVGPFDGGLTGRVAELTGRGDGRLFAFFVQEPSLAEIDPKTARVLSSTPLPVPAPTAWAFAHWGGAFYVFAASGSSTSRLYRHRPGGEAAALLLDTGYRVVGAGVSTCAPLDDGGLVAN